MEEQKVVPDVIDQVPKTKLSVKYGALEANDGNELKPTQVKNIPIVTWQWDGADPNKFYTICMIDPDAPNRKNPIYREWNHWLVTNVKGNNAETGDTIAEYVGAGPPKGSHLHRYVLLVYEQPEKLKFSEQKLSRHSGDHRGNFSIKKFATKYKLGQPIAGNFFQAQWDEYVPKLYEQLEGKLKEQK